jgi:hypothetical protein
MIKILQVNQANEVYNGVNKTTGKPYQIYSWFANVEIDGQIIQNANIKSFKAINFQVEKEFDFTKDERPNIQTGQIYVSYMLKPIGQGQKPFQKTGYQRPIYTKNEYDLLWKHALKMFEKYVEKSPEMISTYIISAVNAGVKIEEEKKEPPKENPVMNIDDKPDASFPKEDKNDNR